MCIQCSWHQKSSKQFVLGFRELIHSPLVSFLNIGLLQNSYPKVGMTVHCNNDYSILKFIKINKTYGSVTFLLELNQRLQFTVIIRNL